MNLIKGVVSVCSDFGVGKSTFALTNGHQPQDIVWVNDDSKSVGFEDQFKLYVDLMHDASGMKIIEFHDYCIDMIDSLPSAKVLVWDTWARFANSLQPYVTKNENLFREPGLYSKKGDIHGGEIWQETYKYEGSIISRLRNKFDLIILTFHLKKLYENNIAIPGAQRPGNDKAINQYSDLRLWLTPNVQGDAPIGLVLKNISKKELTPSGIKVTKVLPLRFVCSWENILNYYNNPIGERQPTDDETPNEFEMSIISGVLTPEQKRLYEASVSYMERREQESDLLLQAELNQEVREKIAEMNGLPLPVILNKLRNDYEWLNLEKLTELKKQG